jgi:hypothetical protein
MQDTAERSQAGPEDLVNETKLIDDEVLHLMGG